MTAMNNGKKAHDHALRVLELMHHEYWNKELMLNIKQELKEAYHNLKVHLREGRCACGDQQSDLEFYQMVYEDMKNAVKSKSMAVMPVLQEELTQYFKRKGISHRCIQSLLNTNHKWVEDI